jgi:hypothetical protein
MAISYTKLSATPERLVYSVSGSDAAAAPRTNAQLKADCVPGPLFDLLNSFTLSVATQAEFSQLIQLIGCPSGGPNAAAPAFSVAPLPEGGGPTGPISLEVFQKVVPGMGESAPALILSIQYLHSIIR